ncbi:MAG: 4,5-DOPA dioxygenase extradiol [Chitinophagales bacterium]|nr:4,5-DOPA dioxygenase extradiol [Chitinophagales bacterium]
MDRRNFIKSVPLAAMAIKLSDFGEQYNEKILPLGDDVSGELMPALFVGHGNPMNAIEENEFSKEWEVIGKSLPTPKAILCVSAHWQTHGTKVCAVEQPETIHDFGGFPQELFDVQYAAKGSPDFAKQTQQAITKTNATLDYEWGLDHGCWSVLRKMYPAAQIPTFQLSLDYDAKPQEHYDVAQQLKEFRSKGILIIGSGNIVHNLGRMQWKDEAYDWAIEFDEKIKSLIEKGDHQSVINYKNLGRAAELSIPTNEHYLPLLYTLGVQDKKDSLSFFNEKATMGSISMRGVKFS